jgi:hypothetical protein
MPRTKLQAEITQPQEPVYHYYSFGETLSPHEAGLLMGTTRQTIMAWIKDKCPFGKMVENVHYWKDSRHYHIIKDPFCALVGIKIKAGDPSCNNSSSAAL